MQNMCETYGALFLNNTQLQDFINHSEYFNDVTHMNIIGAVLYTEFVLKQIKYYLNN